MYLFCFLVHFDYWACSISKTPMFNHLWYYMIIPKHLWVWYLFKFWASRMSKWPFYLERVELLMEEIITVGNQFWTRDIFNWFYKHRMSKHLACLRFFSSTVLLRSGSWKIIFSEFLSLLTSFHSWRSDSLDTVLRFISSDIIFNILRIGNVVFRRR